MTALAIAELTGEQHNQKISVHNYFGKKSKFNDEKNPCDEHKNSLSSAKQIVQGKFSLDAFRMLISVNTLGRYHGYNDILVGVCCLDEC